MNDLQLVGSNGTRSVIRTGNVAIGGREITLIGGPCAVESPVQMNEAARIVKKAGGQILRGGVFKPRTSPYSFQGLGVEGLNYLVDAAREQDLLCVTEVIDAPSLDLVADKIDIIQIGARNMQNFQLLKLAGQIKKPVILKRGLAATIEEWLLAAEYILAAGNPDVILCERGIRTFETSTRNTLDLSAVGVAKALSHLPVIVDPSHAAGRRDLVPALAQAAIVAGADGLLIEMHPNPEEAKSDGAQSLTPEQFRQLAADLAKVANAVSRIMKSSDSKPSLSSLRQQIDIIDQDLVELLAERVKVVKQIAEQKSVEKIRDTIREKEIIQSLSNLANRIGCPPDLIEKVYSQIFDYGVQLQLKSKLVENTSLSMASPGSH